jgi:hypothetical protein
LHVPNAGSLHHVDDGLRLVESDGDGLLVDDMLAVLCRGDRVLGVESVGRADPDDVDVGALAHGLDLGVGLDAVALAGLIARLLARRGDGGELGVGHRGDGRNDGARNATEPG